MCLSASVSVSVSVSYRVTASYLHLRSCSLSPTHTPRARLVAFPGILFLRLVQILIIMFLSLIEATPRSCILVLIVLYIIQY